MNALAIPPRPLLRGIPRATLSPDEVLMPKPNYAFQKRQRELAKKQKKEAKLRERAAEKNPSEATPTDDASVTSQTEENRGG